MTNTPRTITAMLEEQIARWKAASTPLLDDTVPTPSVITVSRQPGSGGSALAHRLAKRLGYSLFDRELIEAVAKSAHMSAAVVETLDERSRNAVSDWVRDIMGSEHLWADDYLRHLIKVIGTIRRHGDAVIVGRGGSFILSHDARLAVRVIGPTERRVRAVARREGMSEVDARRWVRRTEAERNAYIRRYFGEDDGDPVHYDVIVNSGRVPLESAVEMLAKILEPRGD